MLAPVLIFAVGNESRGDDGLGPLLLRELQAYLHANGDAHGFELLEEFQLQIEHAMDMQGRKLVLFIDAGMDTPAPFSFQRLEMNDAPVLYSHALEPQALLQVYRQFYQEMPPEVYVLCIRGERYELGEGLGEDALSHKKAAFEFCKELLREPDGSSWKGLCKLKMLERSIHREDNQHEQASC